MAVWILTMKRARHFSFSRCRGTCAMVVGLSVLLAASGLALETKREVLIRDLADIEGVRDNALVGYGIVVGLHGTGDRQQTYFTIQTLANAMQRMGVKIDPTIVRVANVAAVFVTASLPPFARPGTRLDVTVSSVGDAKSLEGGVLLLTSLHGPDGQVYADAQGSLTVGGYSAGGYGNGKMVNHTTVGRIPEGGIVERDTAVDLSQLSTVSFILRSQDFTAAADVAGIINDSFGQNIATVIDGRRIAVNVAHSGIPSVPELITRIQNLSILVHPPAKVILSERTGTIVMGGDVRLSPVSILHGNLTIEVSTTFSTSQPNPYAKGTTTTVPDTQVTADAAAARSIHLGEGATVTELINGLHAINASAYDIVSILQAIKAAGGLEADLEVI